MTLPELFMVFDCESVGLHGETFACGWVLVRPSGREVGHGLHACPPARARGCQAGRDWLAANLPALPVTCERPADVRRAFWTCWLLHKGEGAALAADCAWPVEARFLARCVDDVRPVTRGGLSAAESPRDWEGPYPLFDVASVRLAAGLDPLGTEERRPDELPAHNPLADARQSARLLVEALGLLAGLAPLEPTRDPGR